MLGDHSFTQLPDLAEAIVGYRSWSLSCSYGKWFLTSPDQRALWTPGAPMHALCECKPEDRSSCHCGFNAFDSQEKLAASTPYMGRDARGEVQMWGEVQGYDKGWRAQMAYPGNISIRSDFENAQEVADEIAQRYGIEVSLHEPLPPGENGAYSQGVILFSQTRRGKSTLLSAALSRSNSPMSAATKAYLSAAGWQLPAATEPPKRTLFSRFCYRLSRIVGIEIVRTPRS